MQKRTKKIIIAAALVIFLSDLFIGLLLFKSRAFSHLAIWDIIESGKESDFYWPPEKAPLFFRLEPDNEQLKMFKEGHLQLADSRENGLRDIIKLAQYVRGLDSAQPDVQYKPLLWDSPEGLVRQIKAGSGSGNCFHLSILFSTYLAALGESSRLWALENNRFDNISHTITEVYVKSIKKWVFIDITFGFYALENDTPLSFLEFRDKLLSGEKDRMQIITLDEKLQGASVLPNFYQRLVTRVFLRTGNDFVNKYNHRYGPLFTLRSSIDKLPNQLRMGIDYLFGKKDTFMHYRDKFSRSLKQDIIAAKVFFYWFIFSMAVLCVLLVALLKNLSKKETLHT